MCIRKEPAIVPDISVIKFIYMNDVICKFPCFILLNFIKYEKKEAIQRSWGHNEYVLLESALINSDQLNIFDLDKESLLKYLKKHVSWNYFSNFIYIPKYLKKIFGEIWRSNDIKNNGFRLDIGFIKQPPIIYKYFRPERAGKLIEEMHLYLSSATSFNDPFDCCLEDEFSKENADNGICCFSKKHDSTLMFSHNAESHKGVCIGFNLKKLKNSLESNNSKIIIMGDQKQEEKLQTHWRYVWYLEKKPILFSDQPVYYATIKKTDWSYEEEIRLFITRFGKLLPKGSYTIDSSAIDSVYFGINSSKDFISEIKTHTNKYPAIKLFRAKRDSDRLWINFASI